MDSPFRPDLLAGKRALVTGGSSGIGWAITKALAEHGADVVVVSRDPKKLEATAEATGASWHAADVRDTAALQDIAAQEKANGGIDILVNAAAGNFPVPFSAMSDNAWKSVVEIVLDGTVATTRAFQDQLMASKDACLVNIVAGYAWTGAPGVSHSGAAKAAVLNLTKSLAVEWAPVRCNAVSPGPIGGTEGMKRLGEDLGLADVVKAGTPLGRFGTPEEVAHGVLYLVSAPYVTGHCLVIDGGQDAMGPFGALWQAMKG